MDNSVESNQIEILNYIWQTSSDGNSWNEVGSHSTYTIKSEDEGKYIRSQVTYKDKQNFYDLFTTGSLDVSKRDPLTGQPTFNLDVDGDG